MSRRIASIFGLVLAAALGAWGMRGGVDEEIPRATRGLEFRREDYARVRAGFPTRLVCKGPSPQPGEALVTPAGAEEVMYRSGGLRLKAYLTRPAGDGRRRPAVLLLHGGFAFGAGQWEMARPFRDAGFVVLMPVPRGENGQGGDFSLFYDEVDDVLAASEALAALPGVDPGRLFVCGHSAGGTLALLAALASGRFRAAASISGSPDLTAFLAASKIRPPFDPSDPDEVRLRSPVAYAGRFKSPVRLYCGDEEFWVQEGTRRTALLAERSGIDAEAIEVPGGHFSSLPAAIGLAIDFFRSR